MLGYCLDLCPSYIFSFSVRVFSSSYLLSLCFYSLLLPIEVFLSVKTDDSESSEFELDISTGEHSEV